MVPSYVSYILLIKKRFMYVHLDTRVSGHPCPPPPCHPSLLTALIGEASQGCFSPFKLQEYHGTVFSWVAVACGAGQFFLR